MSKHPLNVWASANVWASTKKRGEGKTPHPSNECPSGQLFTSCRIEESRLVKNPA